MSQRDLNDRQQKWVTKLQAYDFDIEFVKGKKNVVVDALSQRPRLCALAEVSGDWRDQIVAKYVGDDWASGIVAGTIQDDRYVCSVGWVDQILGQSLFDPYNTV